MSDGLSTNTDRSETVDDLQETIQAYQALLIVLLARLHDCGVSEAQFNDDINRMQRDGLRKRPVGHAPAAIRVLNRALEILGKIVRDRAGPRR